MDFLPLNYLLDNELENIIRNFEKQKKQIMSDQYGILLNQTCLNEALYPTNSNIYIYIYPIYIYNQYMYTCKYIILRM